MAAELKGLAWPLQGSTSGFAAQSFEYCTSLQGDGEVFFLKECTRRYTDSIDRRFCFDIEAADR